MWGFVHPNALFIFLIKLSMSIVAVRHKQKKSYGNRIYIVITLYISRVHIWNLP